MQNDGITAGVNWIVAPSHGAHMDGSKRDEFVSKEMRSDGEFPKTTKTNLYKMSPKAFSLFIRAAKKKRLKSIIS
jgi:hypothetical protein